MVQTRTEGGTMIVCRKCKSQLAYARGIGWYCPKKGCNEDEGFIGRFKGG